MCSARGNGPPLFCGFVFVLNERVKHMSPEEDACRRYSIDPRSWSKLDPAKIQPVKTVSDGKAVRWPTEATK